MLTVVCLQVTITFVCLEEKQIVFGQLTALEAIAESLPPPLFFFLLVVVIFFVRAMFLQVIHIFIRNKTLHLNLVSSVILGLLLFPFLLFF